MKSYSLEAAHLRGFVEQEVEAVPVREWAMTDVGSYRKHSDEIDCLIVGALASGPKSIYTLMALLRAAGHGNATSDTKMDLSYSTTGAIWRSAKNSLRMRGLIYDSWDEYSVTGVKKGRSTLIYRQTTVAARRPGTDAGGRA